MSRSITLPPREHIEVRWLSALSGSYPTCDHAHLETQIHEATQCLYRSLSGQSTSWDMHHLMAVLTGHPSLNELMRVLLALRSAVRQSLADSDIHTVLWLDEQLDLWIENCTSRYNLALKQQSHHRWTELVQRVVQLNTLSYCLAELNASLDLVSAFNATVELARQLSGADLCVLYQRESDRLHLRASSGTARACPQILIADDQNDLEQIVVDQRHRDMSLELVCQQLGVPEVKALHCTPLRVNNIAIGKLATIFLTEKTFTQQELRLQEIFADRAAHAIDNAQIYEQLGTLTAECERRQIACEMHDTLLQTLISLNINLRVLHNHAQQGNWHEVLPLVETARQLGKVAIQEGRDAVSGLREANPSGAAGDLVEALQPEIAAFADRADLQPEVETHGEVYVLPQISHQVRRLVGEALTNVHRHANASRVRIIITANDDQLRVEIRDDGVGFQLSRVDQETSFGLVGMHERARLIHGTVTIDSAPGHGTTVTLTCPLR
ncbi:MAG: GAF domain-containing sensor histidine kinase [Chloroflexi bacterium]|nr:GAF domain-containing sensor histidine kinase [Chloroflexota bacterium]